MHACIVPRVCTVHSTSLCCTTKASKLQKNSKDGNQPYYNPFHHSPKTQESMLEINSLPRTSPAAHAPAAHSHLQSNLHFHPFLSTPFFLAFFLSFFLSFFLILASLIARVRRSNEMRWRVGGDINEGVEVFLQCKEWLRK